MSRRRVSVKDLGVVDCQGWLHRRKEGRSFLGSKWKKYWFVLKKSSLYWYTDKMAEKAEGFINVSGFTIEQATQSRKKHAITATHPLVVTIVIAAESFIEMNKWISKLSEAAEPCEKVDTEECYSEGSEQDGDECVSTCSQDSEQETADSENGDAPQPVSESCTSPVHSETDRAGGAASFPLIHVEDEGEDQEVQEKSPDEMESLYQHLKAASLSPMGRSSQRDFRASFIRRCKDDKVNEKLHLLRILRSTLKAKESELAAVEQVSDPALTAARYRQWRLSNPCLLQQVRDRKHSC
ncbi:interactor protein for cytohesin exchange factors 1-like [Trachinotus anak]|uniref:interactor protein for cytohesin exchange factors 1-like n=1 Tax=Trachinotus anak TaxID=443729 RepID=UPI0039F1C06B